MHLPSKIIGIELQERVIIQTGSAHIITIIWKKLLIVMVGSPETVPFLLLHHHKPNALSASQRGWLWTSHKQHIS